MKTSDLKDFSFRTSTGTSLTAERTVDLTRDTEQSHHVQSYIYYTYVPVQPNSGGQDFEFQ